MTLLTEPWVHTRINVDFLLLVFQDPCGRHDRLPSLLPEIRPLIFPDPWLDEPVSLKQAR
jgi:hypothetical protein